MLKPAILALIRQILTVAGTALVAKGYVQASDIEPVIGAFPTIGSVVWSVADKRNRYVSVACQVDLSPSALAFEIALARLAGQLRFP